MKLLALFAIGCAAAAPVVHETIEVAHEEAPTPFPREAALPAAPSVVIALDMTVLRDTPLWAMIQDAMNSDDAGDVLARRLLMHTARVELGVFGEDHSIVAIARGPLDGDLGEIVADIARAGEAPTPLDRSGFRAYFIEASLVAAQTSADAVVMSDPEHTDELLRTAAGQAPASPLPPDMRTILDRPEFVDAPVRMVFHARRDAGGDPLADLVADAGFAGIAARFEGDVMVVTGAARASSVERAAQHAQRLTELARTTTDEVGSPTLAEGIRNAIVRTDDQWVEFELRMRPEDIEPFMRIVGPLSGL